MELNEILELIGQELELWDEVRKNGSERSALAMEKEAIQVAAMALRFIRYVSSKRASGQTRTPP